MSISPKLLSLLVCPLTHGKLDYDEANDTLVSKQAGLAFPIEDGIPIMDPARAIILESIKKGVKI